MLWYLLGYCNPDTNITEITIQELVPLWGENESVPHLLSQRLVSFEGLLYSGGLVV